jgi:outer membrane protein OmpA-like peptidoglycan-associated protein
LGQTVVSSRNRLPIEQLTIDRKRLERIKDREFEYYSLILFDFGKSDLRSEHNKVVDFIKNRITPNATVYINGYTDLIGEEDINKRISEKRAKAVAERLKIQSAKVEGVGEDKILYDNSTPEGRYYCRTVQITIETPVED